MTILNNPITAFKKSLSICQKSKEIVIVNQAYFCQIKALKDVGLTDLRHLYHLLHHLWQ
jgi:hypothetical protein